MRAEVFFLRMFGFVLAVLGCVQLHQGGLDLPINYKDINVSLPLHLIFILLGALFLLLPKLPLKLLSELPPVKKSKSLSDYIEKLTADNEPPTEAAELAQYVKGFIRWNTIRFWAVLSSATLFFFLYVAVIQPGLTKQAVEANAFATESARLLRLLQDSPLDFSSADLFRHQLLTTTPLIQRPEYKDSSSFEVYRILSKLYSPGIADSSGFDNQMTLLYDEEIRPHIESDTGILKDSIFKVPYDAALEPINSRVLLLTLLAIVCNEQGGQGRFVEPYIQARQILKTAISLSHDSSEIAYTRNALGVNYAGLLRGYASYRNLFSPNTKAGRRIAETIDEIQPLAPLALARLAEAEYNLASRTSISNFARARYLNNSVDLRISLLQQSHVGGIKFEGNRKAEEDFLSENVDPPAFPLQGGWRPARLPAILQRLRSDLDQAIRLTQDPRIYFTRAQLFALAGTLSEKYGVEPGYLCPRRDSCDLAIADLSTAASLGLSRRYFSSTLARELGLEWLWKWEHGKRQLTILAAEQR
jgi:hypothetical protein